MIILFSSILLTLSISKESEGLPFKTHLIMIYFHPHHIQPLFTSPISSSRNPNLELGRVYLEGRGYSHCYISTSTLLTANDIVRSSWRRCITGL
jgi:hypothetical protein